MKNYLKLIKLDEYSATPKYLQIYNAIIQAIESKLIEKDEMLPSINDLSIGLEVSRNTIERSYKELKKFGVISSVNGKGYFVTNTTFNQQIKVLLLFNKLSSHKKIIYDAFATRLGNSAAIDFYIYNNDFNFFKKILTEKIIHYSKVVLVPHFIEEDINAYELINSLPKEKLVLMDKLIPGIEGSFGAVYENFEHDIFHALTQLIEPLSKYNTIKIIFPDNSYYSKNILTGFLNFCATYTFNYEVISDIETEKLEKGTAYINLMENDLVTLVERIIKENLVIAKDIGVISYNETPIKRIIMNGITTISTNFTLMGKIAADIVLNNSFDHIPVPFKVILRKSL
nr:GntR family transcriptional regulator [Mucilaginibacter sp. L294]